MVKAEKIVVLSILFLVVGLFGWSLGAETETTEGQAGGDDGQAATAQEPQAGVETFARRAPAADVEVADAEDAALEAAAPAAPLLDVASVEPAALVEPEPVQALAVRMRPGWDIVSTEGLETTVDPDTLVFRPTEGQTWEEIATPCTATRRRPSRSPRQRRHDRAREAVLVPAKVGSWPNSGSASRWSARESLSGACRGGPRQGLALARDLRGQPRRHRGSRLRGSGHRARDPHALTAGSGPRPSRCGGGRDCQDAVHASLAGSEGGVDEPSAGSRIGSSCATTSIQARRGCSPARAVTRAALRRSRSDSSRRSSRPISPVTDVFSWARLTR